MSERKSPAPVLTSVSSKTIEKEKRSNELDLVFFDTTSIYFEGEGSEGLAQSMGIQKITVLRVNRWL